MAELRILRAIWGKQQGFVFLPTKEAGVFTEHGFKYPDEWSSIEEHVKEYESKGADLYWCPLIFKKARRVKENALQPGVFYADLDTVDPNSIPEELRPTIAWKSSDNNYQSLWVIGEQGENYNFEDVNKALTYALGADKSGWDITQVLRIPGTKNYKYAPPQQGELLWVEKRYYSVPKLVALLKAGQEKAPSSTRTIKEILDGYAISARAQDLVYAEEADVVVGERSDRLWEIETLLIEAGVPVADVIEVVRQCPYNKFKGRRDEMNQIVTEVMKAEKHVRDTHIASVTITNSSAPAPSTAEAQDLVQSFEEFVSERIRPPEWLVRNIWQAGTYGIIAGEPKTYKSVQATDLALSVASGVPFLNSFPVEQTGAVLYIQEENGKQTVQDRVHKIAAAKGIFAMQHVPIYFINNAGLNFQTKQSRALLEQSIEQLNPKLVILDPVYMLFGNVDENSAKEVGDILRWLTSLRNKYGCGLLLCHHYNKGTGSTNATRGGQRIRGTGAFHAWVESALYIMATDTPNKVKVDREFRAFQVYGKVSVEIKMGEPGQLLYQPIIEHSDLSVTLSDKEERVIEALSSKPMALPELEATCKLSQRDTRTAIDTLVTKGVVRKLAGNGGRMSKAVFMLVKEEEENDDDSETT